MLNWNVSARTLDEIPISMRGSFNSSPVPLPRTVYGAEFCCFSSPGVPFHLWPVKHCYSHTVLQVTHTAWVWGTKHASLFSLLGR